MFKRVKKASLEMDLVDMVSNSIGNFLGLSDHEGAAKYGLRLMTVEERDELWKACDRVKEWIKDVQLEELTKGGKR